MKGSSREQWQAHLAGLAQTEGYPKGPEGYLVAFATSYRAYRRDFSLPEVIFPWEKSIEDASKAGTPAPAATTV